MNKKDVTFPRIPVTLTFEEVKIDQWIESNLYPDGKKAEDSIGLDIEWKPNFSKGGTNKASLLQLATSDSVLLVQLLQLQRIPASLRDLLSSQTILKVGVAVFDDLKKLRVGSLAHNKACLSACLRYRHLTSIFNLYVQFFLFSVTKQDDYNIPIGGWVDVGLVASRTFQLDVSGLSNIAEVYFRINHM